MAEIQNSSSLYELKALFTRSQAEFGGESVCGSENGLLLTLSSAVHGETRQLQLWCHTLSKTGRGGTDSQEHQHINQPRGG